jgi:hypothetical protein
MEFKTTEINKLMLVSDINNKSTSSECFVVCKIEGLSAPYITVFGRHIITWTYVWDIEEKPKEYMSAKEMYQFCEIENPAVKDKKSSTVFNWAIYSFHFECNTYRDEPIENFEYSLDLINWQEFIKE